MHTKSSTQPAAIDRDALTAGDAARCTAAALYLMSHYAQRPCPLVAHAVADQLNMLTRHCAEGASQMMQSLASALLPRWQAIASGNPAMIRH